MTGLFTLRTYASAMLTVQPRYRSPQSTWWVVRVESDVGDVATAHCVVLDPTGESTRKALFATNGVWEGLALGQFVRDVCWEVLGEEEADLAVFGSVPNEPVRGTFSWPTDGEQAFVE